MALAQNQAVTIGQMRLIWIDVEAIKIEIDEDIGHGERTADMTGASLEYGPENQLARAARKIVELGRCPGGQSYLGQNFVAFC